MDADDVSKITALVAAQLASHAAQQKTERDRMYEAVAGLASTTTTLAKNVSTMSTDTDKRTAAMMEVFAQKFVERVVPLIVQQAASAPSKKSDPANTEAVANAIVGGVRDLLARSIAPLAQRIESLEHRTVRDR